MRDSRFNSTSRLRHKMAGKRHYLIVTTFLGYLRHFVFAEGNLTSIIIHRWLCEGVKILHKALWFNHKASRGLRKRGFFISSHNKTGLSLNRFSHFTFHISDLHEYNPVRAGCAEYNPLVGEQVNFPVVIVEVFQCGSS